MMNEMEEMEDPQKLCRVVQEHQEAKKEKAVESETICHIVQTLVFGVLFCQPCPSLLYK